MILNCKIQKEIEIKDKAFYLVKDMNGDQEYPVPKSQFKFFPVETGNSYYFFSEYRKDKIFLSFIHPDYKINEIYKLKIIKIEYGTMTLECPPFEGMVKVSHYPWNIENTYIECKVVGYKMGVPLFENVLKTNPNYVEGGIYLFKIVGFGSFSYPSSDSLHDSVILDVNGINLQVRALQWHREDLWKFPDLYCKVVGYIKNGMPKLCVYDNRHPIYELNKIYTFEVESFTDKIISGEGSSKSKIINISDKYKCNYKIGSLPNQENKLKPGDKIECRVLSIGTSILLRQENIKDPFFYTFEEIEPNLQLKNKYFTTQLKQNDEKYLSDLSAQYASKSAFWVFTFCNQLLPRIFFLSIKRQDYAHALEINNLLYKFENWILKNGILQAFTDNIQRKETKIKVTNIIKRLEIRSEILSHLTGVKNDIFLKSIYKLNALKLYEYFSIVKFDLISDVDFVEILEGWKSNETGEEERFFLDRLSSIIDVKKKHLISNIKGDYFVYFKDLPPEAKDSLHKYLLWTYCQYIIYTLIGNNLKRNLISGHLLRLLVHHTLDFSKKELLLQHSFFILSATTLNYELPIFRDQFRIYIDENYLSNKTLTNLSNYWDEIISHKNKIHRIKIIEKHYQGYKVEISGIIGFLPLQNINDQSLKRYPFKAINWETNVEIHLHSKYFNFFICKQVASNHPNYYSKNLSVPSKPGDFVSARVKSVTDFGVFLTTPNGDGLLHKNNISDEYYDDIWVEKYFTANKEVVVKILNITNEKIDLGLKQLRQTEYEQYYFDFLTGNMYFSPEIETEIETTTEVIYKDIEVEKGNVFEQFAIFQEIFENKINYIKLAKIFFANTENARSYLLNIYIDYFFALNDLNSLIDNYSLEKYKIFRNRINEIKKNTDAKTIDKFEESGNLIFFINILSLFNEISEDSNIELMGYIKKYSTDTNPLLKILAKTTLANNLLLSEVNKNNIIEAQEFSLKTLKIIRDYIKNGVFSLAETEEDRLTKEINEKINYWREKIKLDEGENLEFKSTFITPVPNQDKQRIVLNLEEQLANASDHGSKERIKLKIDEINGLTAQKAIIHSALKSIAAFANTNGGYLLLGVSNDKEIFGLEKDFEYFKRDEEKNRDGFGKFFDSKVKDYFGNSFSSLYLEKEFLKFSEGDILIIKINPSLEEVFLLKDENANPTEAIYIRNLSSTEKLDGRELAKFIRRKTIDQLTKFDL